MGVIGKLRRKVEIATINITNREELWKEIREMQQKSGCKRIIDQDWYRYLLVQYSQCGPKKGASDIRPSSIFEVQEGYTRKSNTSPGLILEMLFVILVLSLSSCQSANGVGVSLPEKPQKPLPPCTTPVHKSGDAYGSIQSAGLKRTFLLHLPPSYGQHPQALVVAYHGYSWSAAQMEHTSHLDSEGDKAGFVLALPQGVDDPPSWNAGVGAYGPTGDADDVQFTRDLLSYLAKNYCIDTQHVYITGFSLGSGMAYRIACTLTNQIAAVATVSGAYYSAGGCNATRALPVMEIHGFADPSAPYNGWPARKMIGVPEYLRFWQQVDQCKAASQVIFHTKEVIGTQWSQCASHTEVVHYRIEHGVHSWPDPAVLDADKIIWQFFQQFSS